MSQVSLQNALWADTPVLNPRPCAEPHEAEVRGPILVARPRASDGPIHPKQRLFEHGVPSLDRLDSASRQQLQTARFKPSLYMFDGLRPGDNLRTSLRAAMGHETLSTRGGRIVFSESLEWLQDMCCLAELGKCSLHGLIHPARIELATFSVLG